MNGLFGILRFDGQEVDKQLLEKARFSSPNWEPDHQGSYIDDCFGVVTTERYITKQCEHAPMPFHHKESNHIAAGNMFLTDREKLELKLSASPELADIELIMMAYLKWGEKCVDYLSGKFFFVIWNSSEKKLFMAVDQVGNNGGLYAYKAGKYFLFGNTMEPFRYFCGHLTKNFNIFEHFALDTFPPKDETCYHEVKRLKNAHQIKIKNSNLTLKKYWNLKHSKKQYYCKSKEEYYKIFRSLFTKAIKDGLRTNHPILSEMSGGLDSSAVACIAAPLLAEQGKILYAYTAMPLGLNGESQNPGSKYHEMPLVQEILNQHSNFKHFQYFSNPSSDIFELFKSLWPMLDAPIRNVFNIDWCLNAPITSSKNNNTRVTLNGLMGNYTISHYGYSLRSKLSHLKENLKILRNPIKWYETSYFEIKFLYWNKKRKNIIWKAHHNRSRRKELLDLINNNSPLLQNHLDLYSGSENFCPSLDLNILLYCYHSPEWLFHGRRKSLKESTSYIKETRSLIRNSLIGSVPQSVLENTFFGEQAADWYLQYDQHRKPWHQKLNVCLNQHPKFKSLYDIKALEKIYDENIKTSKNNESISSILIQAMSNTFYYNKI